MFIKTLTVGPLGANCYLIQCTDTQEGIIIDPGGDGELIIRESEKMRLKVKYIINTHGHGDHIAANDTVKNALGGQLVIHKLDSDMLTNHQLNLSGWTGNKLELAKADLTVDDNETLNFGNLTAEVIHTPGHTQGSICLLIRDKLFTGDTLFNGSIGRTDLPGGSYNQIMNSIKNKILTLDENIEVYPGHGPSSDIKSEKKINPFLK